MYEVAVAGVNDIGEGCKSEPSNFRTAGKSMLYLICLMREDEIFNNISVMKLLSVFKIHRWGLNLISD